MRIDLLEAFGLDPNVIAILKLKYGTITSIYHFLAASYCPFPAHFVPAERLPVLLEHYSIDSRRITQRQQ
jgi:hypothetical protein